MRPRHGLNAVRQPRVQIDRISNGVYILDQVVANIDVLLCRPIFSKACRVPDFKRKISREDVVGDLDILQVGRIKIATSAKQY